MPIVLRFFVLVQLLRRVVRDGTFLRIVQTIEPAETSI